MATHSSSLAWKILRTEEPGGLVYGVARVGHDSDRLRGARNTSKQLSAPLDLDVWRETEITVETLACSMAWGITDMSP